MREHLSCLTGPVGASPHTGPQRSPGPLPPLSPGTPISPGAGKSGKGGGTCTPLLRASPRRGRHSGLSSPPPTSVCIPAARPPPLRPHRPAALPRNVRNEAQRGCRPPRQPPTAPRLPTRPPRSQPHPSQQPHPASRCPETWVLPSSKITSPANEAPRPRVVWTL